MGAGNSCLLDHLNHHDDDCHRGARPVRQATSTRSFHQYPSLRPPLPWRLSVVVLRRISGRRRPWLLLLKVDELLRLLLLRHARRSSKVVRLLLLRWQLRLHLLQGRR